MYIVLFSVSLRYKSKPKSMHIETNIFVKRNDSFTLKALSHYLIERLKSPSSVVRCRLFMCIGGNTSLRGFGYL